MSSSPEHHPTSSLAHRLTQGHNTPGTIFGQPARRPARTFRHQTNSFSFDESERASASYEHDRISSSSTTGSTPRPPDNLSLQEERRGCSLESTGVVSNVHSSSSKILEDDEAPLPLLDSDERSEPIRESLSSSPQLPLPPPFSAVSRSVSRAETLPSQTLPALPKYRFRNNPSASPARDDSTGSPGRYHNTSSPKASPPTVGSGEEVVSSPAVSSAKPSFLTSMLTLSARWWPQPEKYFAFCCTSHIFLQDPFANRPSPFTLAVNIAITYTTSKQSQSVFKKS